MSRFFIASMIAYLVSQYFDVWIYSRIKRLTKNRFLWLRNNLSTILSSLLDNTVFSLLAKRLNTVLSNKEDNIVERLFLNHKNLFFVNLLILE